MANTSAANRAEQEIEDILGQGGKLSQEYPDYEYRPQQVRMALEVYRHLIVGEPLLIEAPPGVGKSLGYLVPLALWANQSSSNRALIATGTKALQQQLFDKDTLLLKKILPFPVKIQTLFGSQNYGCKRRCQTLLNFHEHLLGSKYLQETQKLQEHMLENDNTLLHSLPWRPAQPVWNMVQRDSESCTYSVCKEQSCFYFRQKELAKEAQILVVNHALLLKDLIIEPGKLLGEAGAYVIDEAHLFDDSASRSLGITVSAYSIIHILNELVHEKTKLGLLKRLKVKPSILDQYWTMTCNLRDKTRETFKDIVSKADLFTQRQAGKSKMASPQLTQALNSLASLKSSLSDISRAMVKMFSSHVESEEELKDLLSISNRLVEISKKIGVWIDASDTDLAYWVEPDGQGSLVAAQISPEKFLRETLYKTGPRIIYTSATMSIKDNFEFVKDKFGLNGDGHTLPSEVLLESPFDYKKQACVYYDTEAPDPSRNEEQYRKYANTAMLKVIQTLKGRTLCLFTSWSHLKETAEFLRSHGIDPYTQGEMEPTQIIENFLKDSSRPILAVQTFWMGIDVPEGKILSVVVARLPFDSPSDPRTRAVCQLIESKGGNPFKDWLLPSAVLTLKNGFGRQIRSKRHYGAVYIIDSRITQKSYGKTFQKSLPDATKLKSFDELMETLKVLAKIKIPSRTEK